MYENYERNSLMRFEKDARYTEIEYDYKTE